MPFLRSSGQPHANDLIRHLEHAVNVCGEDHVGLGTDGPTSGYPMTEEFIQSHHRFLEERIKAGISAPGESPDVYNFVPEYNQPRRFEALAEDLAARGWTSTRIEKILGKNFARLFSDVWAS
jgi:membrane dipeptidase